MSVVPDKLWLCGERQVVFRHTHVMGILNVTPDSFSDGGRYLDHDAAVAHGEAMADAGADIIDVGGESTRPGAAPVPLAEELERVAPVVEALAQRVRVPISIDTRHAEVARACVAAGASVINDVSGFRDPAMVEVASGCTAGLIVMHMLGEPQTMQVEPAYVDVVAEVAAELAGRVRTLVDAGVSPARIAVDPGIGFGKTTEHNLELLRDLPALDDGERPLVVGVSRKRFIGELTGVAEPAERGAGSVAAAAYCAMRGADVVRVHDVAGTVAAMRVIDAIVRRPGP